MNKKHQSKKVSKIQKEENHALEMKRYNELLAQKKKEEEIKKEVEEEKRQIRER